MSPFEVMGEHWFVTLTVAFLTAGSACKICDTVQEQIKARTCWADTAGRRDLEAKRLDLLEASAERLAAYERSGASAEEQIREREFCHRLQLELGMRDDPVPPYAILHQGQGPTIAELMRGQSPSRARMPLLTPGSQAPRGGAAEALPRVPDETSVDTADRLAARSGSSSTEGPNEPANRPHRRRSIRSPG